jgi:hypothetical protein
MSKIAFCITGWHYPVNFYKQVTSMPGIDIFVISHKPLKDLPNSILKILPNKNIIVRPNYGYDWGCFQQFVETSIWQSYDYIFFMHDDINILDTSFVSACIALLEQGYAVVGNGRPFEKLDWPSTHTAYYAHASWRLPSLQLEHGVVRGSFFATKKDVLEKLKSFEVFWDRLHLSIGFGNYSLIATSGKFGEMYGKKAFAYLSKVNRASPYIVEFERGQDTEKNKSPKKPDRHYIFNHLFMSWYRELSRAYVLAAMRNEARFPNTIMQPIRKAIIHFFAHR